MSKSNTHITVKVTNIQVLYRYGHDCREKLHAVSEFQHGKRKAYKIRYTSIENEIGGVLYGRQQKEKYCSNNFGKSGTQFCKSGSGQQMYVLSPPAQAADRNQKAFQIRRLAYGRKYCHMCEETYTYGSIFEKDVRLIHFQCNELKIYGRQFAR